MAMLTIEQQRKVKETSVFAHCAAIGLQLAGVIHTAEEIIEVAYAMEQYHRSITILKNRRESVSALLHT